jgi:hypothetical protein
MVAGLYAAFAVAASDATQGKSHRIPYWDACASTLGAMRVQTCWVRRPGARPFE